MRARGFTRPLHFGGAMIIRPAKPDDAHGMSTILSEILKVWKSERASDPDYVRSFYIEASDKIQCTVAVGETGEILGFQSLKLASENNVFDVAVGWGVIGTYVKLDIGRRGIGSALFKATKQVAQLAGLANIDATIGDKNALGLGYYDAMGFQIYQVKQDVICKCYKVARL